MMERSEKEVEVTRRHSPILDLIIKSPISKKIRRG